MYDSIEDARVELVNNGWFEAVDMDRESEILECMYRNDYSVEGACNSLNAWIEDIYQEIK